MQKSNFFKCVKKLHFIGISGVSMSGLAKFSALLGKQVSGSDENTKNFEQFTGYGIKLYNGHHKNNVLGADAVIYSSAISMDNPEIKEAKRLKIPIIRRSQYLGMALSFFKRTIAISGSHGKTTATAMLSNILVTAKKHPTCFIGGDDLALGNFVNGEGDIAVAEACEYQKNFLDIFPSISVVLNIDNDHLDSYGCLENEVKTFSKFIKNTIAVLNADDENCRKLFNGTTLTFGIENKANYMAYNLKKGNDGCYSFSVRGYSTYRGRINLKIKGRHNIYNALSAVAVAEILGISFSQCKKTLEKFKGVKRRMELLGDVAGARVFADYAHHPNEIIQAIKTCGVGGDTLVIFQPHTYSRTKLLFEEFCNCLSKCSNLIIYKTYPARESFCSSGSSFRLYKKLQGLTNCQYAHSKNQLENLIKKQVEGNRRILVLGAGDIYEVVNSIIKK